jgi:peptide deformylase
MALLPLHLLGSPVLRERSAEVAELDDEVRRLIDDMFETMEAAQGVGLAANQVGVARRVAVIDADGERFAMVNPVLVEVSGRATGEEGCLSIPDIFGEVTRPERVVLEATGRDGQRFRLEAQGLTARAIQHEIDHLDGILFLDHLGPIRRKMLLARWKKDRRGETGYIKQVKPGRERGDRGERGERGAAAESSAEPSAAE